MRHVLFTLTLLAAPAAAQEVPGSIYDIRGVDDFDRADRVRDRAVEEAGKRTPRYYDNRHVRRPALPTANASRTPAHARVQGATDAPGGDFVFKNRRGRGGGNESRRLAPVSRPH